MHRQVAEKRLVPSTPKPEAARKDWKENAYMYTRTTATRKTHHQGNAKKKRHRKKTSRTLLRRQAPHDF